MECGERVGIAPGQVVEEQEERLDGQERMGERFEKRRRCQGSVKGPRRREVGLLDEEIGPEAGDLGAPDGVEGGERLAAEPGGDGGKAKTALSGIAAGGGGGKALGGRPVAQFVGEAGLADAGAPVSKTT